jgi:hypothetical protein
VIVLFRARDEVLNEINKHKHKLYVAMQFLLLTFPFVCLFVSGKCPSDRTAVILVLSSDPRYVLTVVLCSVLVVSSQILELKFRIIRRI